jgi:hypothetical protein
MSARTEVQAAQRQTGKRYHNLHHMMTREAEAIPQQQQQGTAGASAGPSSSAAASGGAATGPGAAAAEAQEAEAAEEAAAVAGPAAAEELAAAAAAAADAEHSCPICLDDTVARCTVTVCGHKFCSDCIYSIAAPCGPCPICRTPLSRCAVRRWRG